MTRNRGSRSPASSSARPTTSRPSRPRTPAGRHASRHLQPRRCAVLPADRRGALPRQDARRESPQGDHRPAAIAWRNAKDVSPVARRRRPQDARPYPEDRYQTPAEVAQALDRILRGEKVPGLPEPDPVVAAEVSLGEVKAHDGAIRGLAVHPGWTLARHRGRRRPLAPLAPRQIPGGKDIRRRLRRGRSPRDGAGRQVGGDLRHAT